MFNLFLRKMSTNSGGKIENIIRKKLMDNFNPTYLEIINESSQHNVPKGSESHFKIIIVSEKFKDIKTINQHRLVNEILKNELENNIHALSIKTRTPDKWSLNDTIDPSPKCLGGMKSEMESKSNDNNNNNDNGTQ
mmetsp:Transcript_13833/g.17053  ORF Transcript_13833/g.17053 Transcript_13833/m.17053 type:complete len:136 (-) Transcript_13833:503-910(-)